MSIQTCTEALMSRYCFCWHLFFFSPSHFCYFLISCQELENVLECLIVMRYSGSIHNWLQVKSFYAVTDMAFPPKLWSIATRWNTFNFKYAQQSGSALYLNLLSCSLSVVMHVAKSYFIPCFILSDMFSPAVCLLYFWCNRLLPWTFALLNAHDRASRFLKILSWIKWVSWFFSLHSFFLIYFWGLPLWPVLLLFFLIPFSTTPLPYLLVNSIFSY